MAGIGFTLKRIYSRGTVGGMAQSTAAGVFIVAGPSIAAALGLGLLYRVLSGNLHIDASRFMAVVVVAYAASLVIFGAAHYVFTRKIADLLYDHLRREAVGLYLLWAGIAVIVAALLALPISFSLTPVSGPTPLFRAGAVLLFSGISGLWFAMLIASLLEWYVRVLVAYASGIGIGALLAVLGAQYFGDAGALFGYALGQALTTVAITLLAVIAWPPRLERGSSLVKGRASIRNLFLLGASGLAYYGAIWSDKILYWFTKGRPIEGTPFRLFPSYDYAVFIANLTIVPGLVYFIIGLEPILHTRLRRLLNGVIRLPLHRLAHLRYALARDLRSELRSLVYLQGTFTLAAIGLAPLIAQDPGAPRSGALLFAIASLASAFQLFVAVGSNILFYFQRYGMALLALVIYGLVNVLASLLSLWFPAIPPGLGFMVAGFVSSIVLVLGIEGALGSVEMRIFGGAD